MLEVLLRILFLCSGAVKAPLGLSFWKSTFPERTCSWSQSCFTSKCFTFGHDVLHLSSSTVFPPKSNAVPSGRATMLCPSRLSGMSPFSCVQVATSPDTDTCHESLNHPEENPQPPISTMAPLESITMVCLSRAPGASPLRPCDRAIRHSTLPCVIQCTSSAATITSK